MCLSGEGFVLLGLGRDQRPQRSVGGEDAVGTVAMDTRWSEDLGKPVQELQGGEAKGSAAGGDGPGPVVEKGSETSGRSDPRTSFLQPRARAHTPQGNSPVVK